MKNDRKFSNENVRRYHNVVKFFFAFINAVYELRQKIKLNNEIDHSEVFDILLIPKY